TPCDFAALFGSAATGRMTEGSDIDVFVVRPDSVVVEDDVQWHEQLDAFATASTSWTGNDTRILEMSASEVAATIATEQILAEIARDGIVLSGTPGYLASVKPRTDHRQAG
ncbi:MAG: nucleotidyltransferase domain-containing protein, partial [Candidatus Microthrix parvicella]